MVNLTAAERVYEYWIDKASSAADLVLKIVFAVILFLVARKLILWLCDLIRKNMRRFHTEEAVVSFTASMVNGPGAVLSRVISPFLYRARVLRTASFSVSASTGTTVFRVSVISI